MRDKVMIAIMDNLQFMGGVETSDPEVPRKKPNDMLSESNSMRSRKPAGDRGVKEKREQSQCFSEVNEQSEDLVQNLKYDPFKTRCDNNRVGNLQPLDIAPVGNTTDNGKATRIPTRMYKTSKDH